MSNLAHLYEHLKKYKSGHRNLYVASLMVFFWVLFDGIVAFLAPLVITNAGISESMMGIILGSSSVAGMLCDFLLCRLLKNTNYRVMFLWMFILTALYPLLLWESKTISMFLLAMALWGLYYDLYNLGNFDFISRCTPKGEHASSFGVLQVFISLGYLLAPILTGLFIGETINFKPFLLSWVFLGISLLFFFALISLTRKKKKIFTEGEGACSNISLSAFAELRLWKKIGNFILPVLFLTFTLNVVDSFYWTIGPLFSSNLPDINGLGGLFLSAYLLPPLLVGWFVGSFTSHLGKKRTAFISLFLGSLLLCSFYFIHSVILLIIINFLSAFFISLAWPSINGAYADYISESPQLEKEIETLEDSFTNLGFVIGPIVAGYAAEYLGYVNAFFWLGVSGVLVALVLLKITPKSIKIVVDN